MHTSFLEEHLRSFDETQWQNMRDEAGNVLPGIRGKSGASGISQYGEHIGCDLIELQPGAAFPMHTHLGDHVIYAISGKGAITIDGMIHTLDAGKHQSIFVAAQNPHNVGTLPDAQEPFVILAISHPQKEVSATDRMQIVDI